MTSHSTTNVYKPHEFILELYRGIETGFVEVMYKAPSGVRMYPGIHIAWAELPLTDLDPALPYIHANNQKGYGVHLGIGVRGCKYEPEERISETTGRPYTAHPRGKESDITYLTALWVDVDIPGNEGYKRIVSIDAPPSFIVSSGGGWHAYWLLLDPLEVHPGNTDAIKRTLKGLALACGGDTAVSDLNRSLRLPGTINTKPERGGAVCELVDSIPWRIRYEELELAYAPLAAPLRPAITRHVPISNERKVPRWVENYIQTGAVQGERNATLNKAAWQLFNDGFTRAEVDSLLTGRALSDGLDEREIAITINSAQRAKRGAPSVERGLANTMAADDHLMKYRRE